MRSKKQTKNHSQKLVDAMKSIYTSSTPLSSILPVQERVKVAGTSPAARGKGTRSTSDDTMPQKLLLQITDPGKAPSAPKAVANPGTLASPNFSAYMKGTPASYGKKGFDTKAKTYEADIAAFTAASRNYSNYLTNLRTYQSNLTNYNTKVAQRDADTATNTKRTAQYQRDLAKFVATNGKRKVTKKKATRTRGSRNPGYSASKGSR